MLTEGDLRAPARELRYTPLAGFMHVHRCNYNYCKFEIIYIGYTRTPKW